MARNLLRCVRKHVTVHVWTTKRLTSALVNRQKDYSPYAIRFCAAATYRQVVLFSAQSTWYNDDFYPVELLVVIMIYDKTVEEELPTSSAAQTDHTWKQ
jgi:hypothetical protein